MINDIKNIGALCMVAFEKGRYKVLDIDYDIATIENIETGEKRNEMLSFVKVLKREVQK